MVSGEKSEKKSELSQQYLSIFSVSCMHWLQSKRGMCHVYLSSYTITVSSVGAYQVSSIGTKFHGWLSSKCLEFIQIPLTIKNIDQILIYHCIQYWSNMIEFQNHIYKFQIKVPYTHVYLLPQFWRS